MRDLRHLGKISSNVYQQFLERHKTNSKICIKLIEKTTLIASSISVE